MKILLIIGSPYSGKGTIGNYLQEEYNYSYIQFSELIRDEIKFKSKLGKRIVQYFDNGSLIPEEEINSLIGATIEKHKGTEGIIFEGYPRTKIQVDYFNHLLSKKNIDEVKIFVLEISKNELIKRAMSIAKKTGDKVLNEKEIIKQEEERINIYFERSNSIIDYLNPVTKINAEKPIDEIMKDIKSYL